MSAIVKFFGALFTLIFTIIGLFTVYIFAINFNDEAKSNHTKTVISWLDKRNIAEQENAFQHALTLVGTNDDIFNDSHAVQGHFNLSTEEISLLDEFEQACIQQDISHCQQFIKDNHTAAQSLLAAQQQMIESYQQLQTLSLWQQSTELDAPRQSLNYKYLGKASQLAFLYTLLNATEESEVGGAETEHKANNIAIEILDFLADDYQLYANVYRHPQDLYSNMFAAGMLETNIQLTRQWYQQLLESRASQNETVKLAHIYQQSLSYEQSNYHTLLAGEWLFSHQTFAQLTQQEFEISSLSSYSDALFSYFLQPQSSDNTRAQFSVEVTHYLNGTTDKINNDSQAMCHLPPVEKLWAMRFNPVGKIFNCLNRPNYYSQIVETNNELEQARLALFN
ncbi:hypothetical protein [Shewanella maritima]|uniref:hypothetical protein n=1 Tax=Shewanella maritima TaxID=2520507 RepID=UPI00373530F2